MMQSTQSWCSVTARSLGVERKVGTGFRREGTRVRLRPVHVDGDVWQKPSQYCKVVILQLRYMNYKKKTSLGNTVEYVCSVLDFISFPTTDFLLELFFSCVS